MHPHLKASLPRKGVKVKPARKADGIRRRWCKSSRPDGRALMG
nr:MAG TPA: hypothetical protein [Ackermannviridae sp.]